MAGFVSLISLEGVLAHATKEYAQAVPIPPGMALFSALRSVGRVLFSSTHDRKQVEYWLKVSGINATQYEVLYAREHKDEDRDERALRIRHLSLARAAGYPLSLFVDANPDVVGRAFGMGVVSLLFAHPSYARPEFRPDAPDPKKLWSQVTESITRDRELIASDNRRRFNDEPVYSD